MYDDAAEVIVHIEKNQIRRALLGFTIIIVNYAADRISKQWAILTLKGKGIVNVIGDFFILIYAENTGAFLSAGAGWPSIIKYILLLIIPLLLCCYGIYYIFIKEKRYSHIVSLACIIGGGLGNLIDRLVNNFIVVDFLNFGIGKLRTGILNVADLSVTFGALAFIIIEMGRKRKEQNLLEGYKELDIDTNTQDK